MEQAATRPEIDPLSPENASPRRWFAVAAVASGILLGALFMGAGTARAAWQEIAQLLSLQGKPEPAAANVLSEHEIEVLDQMTPQSQAQLLLERSINHYRGANDQIAQRVDRWRGKIKLDQKLNSLFMTALNSDDLRVRAAAIEIDLACRNLEKSAVTVDRLEHDARFGEQGPRANALWDIALLANRGVEPGRAVEILLASIHDQNVNIRYWAVEGLAYLGTDDAVAPLLQVFHDDSSPMIRERAACGLAQSGMLSEKQRRSCLTSPPTRLWIRRRTNGFFRLCATSPDRLYRMMPPPGGTGTAPTTDSGRPLRGTLSRTHRDCGSREICSVEI